MIHLRSYSNFINESKIDIASEVDGEIETLISDMLKNKECEQVDTGYLEIETPFIINPDSNNKEWINKTGMVFYPELLTYGNSDRSGKVQRTPWIACRVSIEGEKTDAEMKELLNWLVSLIKKSGYIPFMDEDARFNHWKENKGKGFSEYTCYVNPSYPKGHWENHALDD
jgi:hypothetical protein